MPDVTDTPRSKRHVDWAKQEMRDALNRKMEEYHAEELIPYLNHRIALRDQYERLMKYLGTPEEDIKKW